MRVRSLDLYLPKPLRMPDDEILIPLESSQQS